MSDLAVVIPEPETLDLASVPALAGAIIAEAAEVEDIPTLEEMRARTAAITAYLGRKNKDAAKAMNAADLALKIRIGELLGPAEHGGDRKSDQVPRGGLDPSPGISRRQVHKFRKMAEHKDVPEVAEAIENGESQNEVMRRIEAAIANNPLPADPSSNSRAAVEARVTKARKMASEGYTSHQISEAIGVKHFSHFKSKHGIDVPADAVVGPRTKVDANRVIQESASTLEGVAMGLDLIDAEQIDRDSLDALCASMYESIRQITKFYKRMKEVSDNA